jgi:hypothetical protein
MLYPWGMSKNFHQTPQEQKALHDAWNADPKVVALAEAVRIASLANGWGGVEGMTAALRFTNEWVATHGDLPDSGIFCP